MKKILRGIVPIDIFPFIFLPLGTIISSKKEELIGILDHFNIQVVVVVFKSCTILEDIGM